MKYIKQYEKVNKKQPQIGDYVLLKRTTYNEDFENFIANNIGLITEITNKKRNIEVKFFNVPENIEHLSFFPNGGGWTYFKTYDIKHISKNKEDLTVFLTAKKYNL